MGGRQFHHKSIFLLVCTKVYMSCVLHAIFIIHGPCGFFATVQLHTYPKSGMGIITAPCKKHNWFGVGGGGGFIIDFTSVF